MYKLVVVGTILGFAAAYHPVSQEIVNEIRQKASWKALDVEQNPLAAKTYDQIKSMLGLNLNIDSTHKFAEPVVAENLPTNFDGRTAFPGCIHPIRDQQSCGSCWAFAGSETLSDRFCIASNGATNVILSPEDLVACDRTNFGCNGGNLATEWKYLEKTGIVTDTCFPYSSGDGSEPKCPSSCIDGEPYTKYKCVEGSTVKATTVEQMKSELYNHGSLETGFSVYADFMNYKEGVYYHVSGRLEGGHAVKVVGWGTEGGLDYWLCANSWNTSWGMEGFFKIKMGDSGIDDNMFACTPELKSSAITF